MVESKLSHPSQDNESKILTDSNKWQASNPKTYRYDKPQNKPSPDPEAETDFQGGCTDLEGYIFDLGPRASNKFSLTMKGLERYLGSTYSEIFQPAIMTETSATVTDPEMTTITDLGIDHPKSDVDMSYLEKITSMKPSTKS